MQCLYYKDIGIDCGDPPNIMGCDVTQTGTICDSTATYTPQINYTLVGNGTLICDENGQWQDQNGIFPQCPESKSQESVLFLDLLWL